MAHSAMHFGIGLSAGALSGIPFLLTAFKEQAARNCRTWLVISYSLGAVAVFPSFLSAIGVPDSVTSAWYMNIFLLHPVINRLKSGGKLIGEVLIVFSFVCQYIMLMTILYRTRKAPAEQT